MIKILTTQPNVSSLLVSFNIFAYNSTRKVQHAAININIDEQGAQDLKA